MGPSGASWPGFPDPVAPTAPLTMWQDAQGKTWIAQGNVFGGNWRDPRDVLTFRATSTPAGFSISGWTAMALTNLDGQDPYGFWNRASAWFPVPLNGIYQVTAQASVTQNLTQGWWLQVGMVRSPTSAPQLMRTGAQSSYSGFSGNYITATCTALLSLAAGAVIQPWCLPSNLMTVVSNINQTYFELAYLGTGNGPGAAVDIGG